MGNWNQVLVLKEKTSGRSIHRKQASDFLNVINSCKLLDMGISGPKITWLIRGVRVGSS